MLAWACTELGARLCHAANAGTGGPQHTRPCPLSQDYLETKRLACPRFYFVAVADLLDILANGARPAAIVK